MGGGLPRVLQGNPGPTIAGYSWLVDLLHCKSPNMELSRPQQLDWPLSMEVPVPHRLARRQICHLPAQHARADVYTAVVRV
eukprot:2523191-Amphidinium_carterae.1